MEPTISRKIEPGHYLPHAYRLLRKAQWRLSIIYLDRLEMKYPNLGEIHLAKSFAYYAVNEIAAVKASLEHACRLRTEEACDDLKKIKRLPDIILFFNHSCIITLRFIVNAGIFSSKESKKAPGEKYQGLEKGG